MAKISIFGKGNMGQAIGGNFTDAGNEVEYITSDTPKTELQDIIVLAVPYPAVTDIINEYREDLNGKVVVDITNPVNFETFDSLVVPADSSATAIIAEQLPNSKVVKAFNTTFAGTLASKKVGGSHPTTVLVAGDDTEAKDMLVKVLEGSGLESMDVGGLKRARELEAIGFLQISLASAEKVSWTGGFGVFK